MAKIDRITTDAGIEEVFQLARDASLSNIGVICTRSDVCIHPATSTCHAAPPDLSKQDITADEAKQDWPTERPKIEALQRRIETEEHQINSLNADIKDFQNDILNLDQNEKDELLSLGIDLKRAE